MSKSLQNFLGLLAGLVIGSTVNMGLIAISSSIIPPPYGVDVSSMKSLIDNIHLFEPKHFIMPFIAHSFGSLSGAFFTAIIAKSFRLGLALIIGAFFLLGGIMNVIILQGAPIWFDILDLAIAYIPMALLAYKLSLLVKAFS